LFGASWQDACVQGYIADARRLHRHGANSPLASQDMNKDRYDTPVKFLAASGASLFLDANMSNSQMAQLLFDHGADIAVKGNDAALFAASVRCDIDILKLLLDRATESEQRYSHKMRNHHFWCLNQGNRHYIFDDTFHDKRIGVHSASTAVLVRFILRYKPTMPELALIAAGRNGRTDDIQLIFDTCHVSPKVLVNVLEVLKGSFEKVEDKNAEDTDEDEEDEDEEDEEDGTEKNLSDRLDDTMTLWRPIRINGHFNPRIFDNVRLLREKLRSVQKTDGSADRGID
jgi:hypothetical protein